MNDQVKFEVKEMQGLEQQLRAAEEPGHRDDLRWARQAMQEEVDSVNKNPDKTFVRKVFQGVTLVDENKPNNGSTNLNDIAVLPVMKMNSDHIEILADDRIESDSRKALARANAGLPVTASDQQVQLKWQNEHKASFGLPDSASKSQVDELDQEQARVIRMQSELAYQIRQKADENTIRPYLEQLQEELAFVNKRPLFAEHLYKGLSNSQATDCVEFVKGRGLILRDWDSIKAAAAPPSDSG